MRAIGYVRVSTDKQAVEGVSLEAQTEKVRAMAVVQGAELAEIIVDAESAKSLNRPGMERLLNLVDARAVDVVIIAKLDRLTRSVKDLAELLERFTCRGVSLVRAWFNQLSFKDRPAPVVEARESSVFEVWFFGYFMRKAG
jgi:DNA invertase Pin-like site-specific DNA recombinase